MAEPKVRIEVMAHGPYEVTGNLPLVPRSPVRTAEGEAVAWTFGGEIDHPATYYLCRCGQSRNKPFCDGSHAFVLFDGTEEAPTTTFDERAEVHEGPSVTVMVDTEICHHSRFCKYEATNYFEMIPGTDDTNMLSQLTGMIDRCPSGALRLEIGGVDVEPVLPKQISPIADGPLFVSGGVEVVRSDDEPLEQSNRMSLCRCGASKIKPICDGSHLDLGFEA